VITVLDPDAARTALAAGELACPRPGCGGRLRPWSRARARWVRGRDGTSVQVRPDRAKCGACRRSHVLLPAQFLPRRGYDVHVVGAALLAAAEGAGYRRVAAAVDVPASTVRGWLTSVRARSTSLVAGALELIRAAGQDWSWPARLPAWAGWRLPEAVAALAGAARGYALALARPIRPPLRLVPAGRTGIDYLRLIAERHRLALQAGFGVIDPTGLLDDLRGWPLISVFARGGLLAPGPDG
jgi:Domain of unknown function (DUF6431)